MGVLGKFLRSVIPYELREEINTIPGYVHEKTVMTPEGTVYIWYDLLLRIFQYLERKDSIYENSIRNWLENILYQYGNKLYSNRTIEFFKIEFPNAAELKDRLWVVNRPSNRAEQGIKIHIPFPFRNWDPKNLWYAAIATTISKILGEDDIKIIRNKWDYISINNNPLQRGKHIVIYTKSSQGAVKVIYAIGCLNYMIKQCYKNSFEMVPPRDIPTIYPGIFIRPSGYAGGYLTFEKERDHIFINDDELRESLGKSVWTILNFYKEVEPFIERMRYILEEPNVVVAKKQL